MKCLLSCCGLKSGPLYPELKLILTELQGLILSTPSLVSILVYSVLGFGFASAGLMIILEIIFAKITRRNRQRTGSPLCTILLLLVLSASLTAVTIWMIGTFYDHTYDPCLLSEFCEWENQHIKIPSSEEWNICGI